MNGNTKVLFKDGHFQGEGKITWADGSYEYGTYKDDYLTPIDISENVKVFTNTSDYIGRCVEFTGLVCTTPENANGMVAFQMYTNIAERENSIYVFIGDTSFKVSDGDYIKIIGIVRDVIEGYNMFGAELSFPAVTASSYEKISYIDAVSPTLNSIEVNQTQTQAGYSLTVQKIEFAANETRVYLSVANNGQTEFSVYTYSALIQQDGRQYETESNWDADYPEIQSDLLVGSTTDGILLFPQINQTTFKLVLPANSDNYREDIDDYIFEIAL